MISHTLNPVIFDLGLVQIRYYGLFYVIGFIVTYFLLRYLVKLKKIDMTKDDVLDMLVYVGFGMLAGGRFFYFVFYNPLILLKAPWSLFMLWTGGMSFHGALIGTAVAGLLYCKIKKKDFFLLADISMIPIALILALGRIGNFINGELYGRLWDGTLCIDYSGNTNLNNPSQGCRFPSQFIESLKNLFIYVVLWYLKDRKLPKGFLMWSFIFMYGILRFLVEFIRQPDPQIGLIFGWMSMGQLLCIPMVLLGGYMLYSLWRKR